MERDRAAELTQGAQEAHSQLRDTYDARKAEADPHRARRKELRDTAARTSDKFKCARGQGCCVRNSESSGFRVRWESFWKLVHVGWRGRN